MGYVIKGVFLPFRRILSGPRRQPNEPIFSNKIFLKSRLSYESLEPLIVTISISGAYLSSTSGAKIMAKKLSFRKIKKFHKRQNSHLRANFRQPYLGGKMS